MMNNDDRHIVDTIRQNPDEGFRLLLERYMQPLYWHVRRLVVNHDDANDVVQETLMRLFRSIDTFRGDSALSTWIYRIATNEALRFLGKKRESLSIDDEEASVGALLADDMTDYTDLEAVKLQKAILALPTKQQLAFNLRYYEEMDYDQIAEVTGSTAAAVKANYHFAKEKIINYLRSND